MGYNHKHSQAFSCPPETYHQFILGHERSDFFKRMKNEHPEPSGTKGDPASNHHIGMTFPEEVSTLASIVEENQQQ